MRRAIALLELIFAIVVIGITLVSVPNLIRTTTKASNGAITQEAISNVASHIDMVMSQFWDETATDPKYNNPILVVDNGNPSLDEARDSNGFLLGRRVGSAVTTSRRFAVDINGTKLIASSVLSLEAGEVEPDDIDDFNNQTLILHNREDADVQKGDYKDSSVQITTTVNYIIDRPTNVSNYNNSVIDFDNPFNTANITNRSTNIKAISVVLTSINDPKKRVVLRGFSCNIGSSKLKERKF